MLKIINCLEAIARNIKPGFLTVACVLLLHEQYPAHADVTIGSYIHQSRRYIFFVGESSEPFDMQCKFRVFAEYIDAAAKSVGIREIAISTIIRARAVKFQQEAGREHIELLESQFSSPTILRIERPEKDCDENIFFLGTNFSYQGTMKNGLPDGDGTKTFTDGTKEQGTYKAGKREGQFEIQYSNGRKFIGTYSDDIRTVGVQTYPDGSQYEGNFNAAGPEGKGVWRFQDGSHSDGQFKNGLLEGSGKSFDKEGKLAYEGQFASGKRNGEGTLYMENGGKFVGTFKDGKQNGEGTFSSSDGKKLLAVWKDGKLDGHAIEYRPGDLTWKGRYEDGKLVAGDITNRTHTGPSLSLQVCNRSTRNIHVAVGYKNNNVWYASGWWEASVGKCVRPNIVSDANASVYIRFSEKKDGSGKNWTATGSTEHFCIDEANFLLPDKACKESWGESMKLAIFGIIEQWTNKSQQFDYTFQLPD